MDQLTIADIPVRVVFEYILLLNLQIFLSTTTLLMVMVMVIIVDNNNNIKYSESDNSMKNYRDRTYKPNYQYSTKERTKTIPF